MTNDVPDGAVSFEEKASVLATLREYRRWVDRRDLLVCAARRAGASYDEIVEASGLARGTVNSILTKAGLVGRHSPSKEAPVPTTAETTSPGMAARFFPHHPHFISVTEKWGGEVRLYKFRPFTGDEPKPENQPAPDKDTTDPAEYQARWDEWWERTREIDAARKLWQKARYYRDVTPLVDAAIKARPPVDKALDAMRKAWEALDNALVWPVAVKQLLDAQEAARQALARWVDDYAFPLAKAEGSQPFYVLEEVANWRDIAAQLNGGQRIRWDIGDYYKGDRYCRADYSGSPLDDLDAEIKQQQDRLSEIAKYAKEDS